MQKMNLVKAKKSNCDFLAHFQKKPLCLKASKFAIISYNIQLSTTSELLHSYLIHTQASQ